MNDDIESEGYGAGDPEGVRIIGADEAERAMGRDDIARRRRPEEPRPGDRPGRPPADAPEPVLRFPLPSDDDPGAAPGLPHWSDPPTGEFTAVGGNIFDDPQPEVGDWTGFSSSAPRWRDADDPWADADDVRNLGDQGDRLGALDDSDRDPEDFFSFDDIDDAGAPRSVFDAPAADTGYADPGYADGGYADPGYDDAAYASGGYDDAGYADPAAGYDDGGYDAGDGYGTTVQPAVPGDYDDPRPIVVGGGRVTPGPARPREAQAGVGGDRDLGQAAIVGVAFIAVAGVLFFLGPAAAMLLVIPVVTLAAAEFFTKLREVGFAPNALVGSVATASLVIAAYHRGTEAIPLILFLTVAVLLGWYLLGLDDENATVNVGLTLLGVVWVGVFGAHAAAMLAVQGAGIGDAGKGILFGAILATVGYDVGGYFVGRSVGQSQLSEASPNKTVEGLFGGCALALIVALVYGYLSEPLGSGGDGLRLGLAVAVAAPLGDLCQSKIKRDLGVKDMGSVLPGHGGLLDRFDALLFALPAVYYVAQYSDFFL